ncbi:MAG: hypothetical protein H0U73_10375 [Tatlockia sp.]|nr:hypothetical protein [Tatlockia sp.]
MLMIPHLSTHFNKRAYSPIDAADKENCRQDFAIALYPGHMRKKDNRTHLEITKWPHLVEIWLKTIGMISK